MTDDDPALMKRLAALEAEVKAESQAQSARKAAALAALQAQRVTRAATREAPRARPVQRPKPVEPEPPERDRDRPDRLDDLGGALALASKANRVKNELARKPKQGEKSWVRSGVLSLTGPPGWLYAGSWREAVPATAAWVTLLVVASKFLPWILMMPVLLVAMPLSAVAGVVYALQYNREGQRQRLFGDRSKQPAKQLRSGRATDRDDG